MGEERKRLIAMVTKELEGLSPEDRAERVMQITFYDKTPYQVFDCLQRDAKLKEMRNRRIEDHHGEPGNGRVLLHQPALPTCITRTPSTRAR